MSKKIIWIILLLVLVGGGVYLLTKGPKEEAVVEEEEEVVQEGEEEEDEEQEYEYTGDTDFSDFSTDTQTLGELSEAQFSIVSLQDESKDGYHEFVFTLRSEDDEEIEPYVIASYIPNMGVVRLDLQGISRDSTGIGYQQERSIGKSGITRIYHNVSAQADQELYDIGVLRSTPFLLSSQQNENDEWEITLKVKYPGESTVDIDLGLEEYTTMDQEIAGIGASENASIISYTYGRPSGLLKLVWSVGGDGESPIPSVSASYNLDNELVVVFESLSIDRVASFAKTMNLPSGISGKSEREGEKSTYTFGNLGGRREYRLSASLSPNQVVLEIR